jgi:tRNA A58 N-methylase Trm61
MSTPRHDASRLHDGMHYPVGHLIGVFPTADEAEQAAQSLYDAGYTDIEILEGPASQEILDSTERAASPLARAWKRLSVYLSDEDDALRAAADALRHGHAIVMVYASDKAQQDQAESILRAHSARGLTYFGRWSITEVNP